MEIQVRPAEWLFFKGIILNLVHNLNLHTVLNTE